MCFMDFPTTDGSEAIINYVFFLLFLLPWVGFPLFLRNRINGQKPYDEVYLRGVVDFRSSKLYQWYVIFIVLILSIIIVYGMNDLFSDGDWSSMQEMVVAVILLVLVVPIETEPLKLPSPFPKFPEPNTIIEQLKVLVANSDRIISMAVQETWTSCSGSCSGEPQTPAVTPASVPMQNKASDPV